MEECIQLAGKENTQSNLRTEKFSCTISALDLCFAGYNQPLTRSELYMGIMAPYVHIQLQCLADYDTESFLFYATIGSLITSVSSLK